MNRSRASLSPSAAGRLTSTCSISGDTSAMWSALPSSAPAHSVSLGRYHAVGDAVHQVDGRADRRQPSVRRQRRQLRAPLADHRLQLGRQRLQLARVGELPQLLAPIGRQARRRRRGRRAILVQRRAQGVAQRAAIRFGREVIDLAVQQHHQTVVVGLHRRQPRWCLDLVPDQEAQHAPQIVVAADADHVGDVARQRGIGGGDQRQAAREAESENPDARVTDQIAPAAEVDGGVADHRNTLARDAVVGQVGHLRRQHDQPGARQLARERHHAPLVHALVVDSVRDDQPPSAGLAPQPVDARAKRPVGAGDGQVLLDQRACAVGAAPAAWADDSADSILPARQ